MGDSDRRRGWPPAALKDPTRCRRSANLPRARPPYGVSPLNFQLSTLCLTVPSSSPCREGRSVESVQSVVSGFEFLYLRNLRNLRTKVVGFESVKSVAGITVDSPSCSRSEIHVHRQESEGAQLHHDRGRDEEPVDGRVVGGEVVLGQEQAEMHGGEEDAHESAHIGQHHE